MRCFLFIALFATAFALLEAIERPGRCPRDTDLKPFTTLNLDTVVGPAPAVATIWSQYRNKFAPTNANPETFQCSNMTLSNRRGRVMDVRSNHVERIRRATRPVVWTGTLTVRSVNPPGSAFSDLNYSNVGIRMNGWLLAHVNYKWRLYYTCRNHPTRQVFHESATLFTVQQQPSPAELTSFLKATNEHLRQNGLQRLTLGRAEKIDNRPAACRIRRN